jgi:hypothetical protein
MGSGIRGYVAPASLRFRFHPLDSPCGSFQPFGARAAGMPPYRHARMRALRPAVFRSAFARSYGGQPSPGEAPN